MTSTARNTAHTGNVTIDGVEMPIEAARAAEAVGVDVAADLARMRAGLTAEALLAECVDGCEDDADLVADWEAYVLAVSVAAMAA